MIDLGKYLARFSRGTVRERLDALADLRDLREREVLDLRAKIATLEAEIEARTKTVSGVIDALEETIKKECVQRRRTVKGSRLQVVYTKGRVTWNNDGLDGYAVNHQEVLRFRKEGEASAKIVSR